MTSVCCVSVPFCVGATTKTQENVLSVQKHLIIHATLKHKHILLSNACKCFKFKQASLIHFSPIFPLLCDFYFLILHAIKLLSFFYKKTFSHTASFWHGACAFWFSICFWLFLSSRCGSLFMRMSNDRDVIRRVLWVMKPQLWERRISSTSGAFLSLPWTQTLFVQDQWQIMH